MPVRVKANLRKYRTALNQRVIPGANKRVRDAVYQESHKQFRDDTGRLRKSIRVDSGVVAIGSRLEHYYRYVRRLRRGDGRIWLRATARRVQERALQESAQESGIT